MRNLCVGKGQGGLQVDKFLAGANYGLWQKGDPPSRPAGELFRNFDRSVGVVFIKCTAPEQNGDNNTVESLTRLMLPRLDLPRDP